MRLFSETVEARLAMLAIAGAALFLFLFGVVGLLRSSYFGFDFEIFYQSGINFLSGKNPWLSSIGTGQPFSYPPQIGPIVALYGALPYKLALSLHCLVNLLSIGIIAYLANKWFLKITDFRKMDLAQGLGIAIIIGNPFMMSSVYQGQLSLPAAAAVLLSWNFYKDNKILLAGLFLGFATIKPQVSLFYIIWLCLGFNVRVLAIGFVTAVVMLTPSLIANGVWGAFDSWFKSMAYYSTVPENMPGFQHVVGLESFFAALGINGTGVFFKPLGLLAAIALYYKRSYFSPEFTVSCFL